jgi:hypothetical protein
MKLTPKSRRATPAKFDRSIASFVWKNRKEDVMKAIIRITLVILAAVTFSFAKELPNAPSAVLSVNAEVEAMVPVTTSSTSRASKPAPVAGQIETNPIDAKFLSLAIVSTGSTFADSYTTLFARQNWLAGRKGVCNEEVESAYLYGTHPTVGRAYLVASAKSAGALVAAYYLRKHHSRLWSLPLIGNSIISLQGVTQNMIECN